MNSFRAATRIQKLEEVREGVLDGSWIILSTSLAAQHQIKSAPEERVGL